MKKFILLLVAGLVFGPRISYAQIERNCGTMDHLHELEQQDPGLTQRMQAIEAFTQRFVQQPDGDQARAVIRIPVVVHVVYRTATENISDAQIQSQIDVLNEDFRRLNADADNTWPQAADAEIEFCLASVDPNGNATTGITRTSTTVTSHGTDNSVKFNSQGGKDAWPAGDYLNMWVCNIGGSILGYAQFPGGAAATDGVVMDYRYFGTIGTATAPFDLGRTATHEVGHWLNLRHIWGDGNCSVDDFVSDTPTSDAPNYGCAVGHVSCSSTDMVQNYMDYSDDGCMNLFTTGQKNRMRALFAAGGARASLLNSNGCGTSGGGGGGSSCAATVTSFPYAESFESGLGQWTQASGDDFDWTRRSGGTPSSGTGPSSAADGSFYMYVEASSPNYPSKTTIFNSPCYDLSGLSSPSFTFQYHMNGTSVGTLSLQASTDGSSWSTVFTRSGAQGTAWNSATVDLSAFAGQSEVRLRFVGATSSSWSGDMCVDNLGLSGSSGGGGGGCTDTEVTLTLVLDNYPGETTWQLIAAGGSVVSSGGPYSTAGATVTETFCLPDGCYDFVINDSYGDGICCAYGSGSYAVVDAGGTTLASGGAFGSSETTNFCLGGGGGGGSCPSLDFNAYSILAHGGQDVSGTYQVQDAGATLFLSNNTWKYLPFNYTVTASTVLEFEFRSTTEGEIHGVGFDTDNTISRNRTFQVHGTQNWGISTYNNYAGGGAWTTYTIPVGSAFTGTFSRLVFVNDHDASPSNATSYFRNVKLYEGSCGTRQAAPALRTFAPQEGMALYPNPASDVLNLAFRHKEATEAQVRIYDLTGRVVQTLRMTTVAGDNTLQVSTDTLPAGGYLLQLQAGSRQFAERFVVTH
ncbi:MAG: T9SS C-terminal target domain-containing protein [Bacteroidetes bacterium]|nr:MAG: T9SS C-terminal target domain-containing protein [Bacteroidota bacterium]